MRSKGQEAETRALADSACTQVARQGEECDITEQCAPTTSAFLPSSLAVNSHPSPTPGFLQCKHHSGLDQAGGMVHSKPWWGRRCCHSGCAVNLLSIFIYQGPHRHQSRWPGLSPQQWSSRLLGDIRGMPPVWYDQIPHNRTTRQPRKMPISLSLTAHQSYTHVCSFYTDTWWLGMAVFH